MCWIWPRKHLSTCSLQHSSFCYELYGDNEADLDSWARSLKQAKWTWGSRVLILRMSWMFQVQFSLLLRSPNLDVLIRTISWPQCRRNSYGFTQRTGRTREIRGKFSEEKKQPVCHNEIKTMSRELQLTQYKECFISIDIVFRLYIYEMKGNGFGNHIVLNLTCC
jgi:hypothetical protein